MNITSTKTCIVTFTVEYFEATEGGMDTDSYGGSVETIQEAIQLLADAENSTKSVKNGPKWMIVARVKTIVK